jgi:hypothetical protein
MAAAVPGYLRGWSGATGHARPSVSLSRSPWPCRMFIRPVFDDKDAHVDRVDAPGVPLPDGTQHFLGVRPSGQQRTKRLGVEVLAGPEDDNVALNRPRVPRGLVLRDP